MNISIMYNNLVCVAKLCALAAPGKYAPPILHTIRLTADSGRLTLQATDLEFSITASMGARVEIAGDLCVALNKMYTTPAKSDYRLDLTLESETLTIAHGERHHDTLHSISPDEFPTFTRLDTAIGTLDAQQFKRGLEFVVGVKSKHDPLIYLAAQDNALTLTAYDGKRIHVATIPAELTGSFSPCAISLDAAKRLIRVFSKGTLNIGQASEFLYIVGEVAPLVVPVEVRIKTSDRRPADFSKVSYADYIYTFQCYADSLRRAIKRAKVFSKYIALTTERYFNEIDGAPVCQSAVYVRAESEDLGDISTEIASAAPLALPNRVILLWIDQALHALDTAAKITSEPITVRINKAGDPIFIEVSSEGIKLSAAIAAMEDPRAHTAYYNPVTLDQEAAAQWREHEAAERDYCDWVRDQLGLESYTRTNHALYRMRGLLHYDGKYYDLEETYCYFYADGPVPGFQMSRRVA